MPTFIELSLILVLVAVVSLIMRLLRQPLIVGYIATGILVGPYVLDVLHSKDEMELFSKIGISILLFIVGLSLNPDIVKEVGKASFYTGLGQIIFTTIFGYVIIRLLGFDSTGSLYAAVALTFSSTIIILKLLADKGDTRKLYGKISLGLLLVQDLVATIILLGVAAIGAVAETGGIGASNLASVLGLEFARILVWGGGIAIVMYFVSKRVLPRLVSYVGGNQEVLFIFSIAWGLGLASLFHLIGFSIEIGSLLAGVMLAVSPFAYEIGSRMKPLRDFFVLIFFVLLGAQMSFGDISVILVPAIILSVFVLVGNPLIMFFIANVLGYRNKTSFMAGLTVAQISEFSLILVSLGYALGHIGREIVSLVTLVGIATIAGSTYLILYSDKIYAVFARPLKALAIRKRHFREGRDYSGHSHSRTSSSDLAKNEGMPDIMILGYDRVGHEFVSAAEEVSSNFIVVDYNPESIARLHEKGIPYRFGDAEDLEFMQDIGFTGAKLVVSTIPDHKTNLLAVRFYRTHNQSGVIIVIAHSVRDAEELYSAGASYVIMPHHLGAHHAALMIARHGFESAKFAEEREAHLARLSKVKARG